MVKLPYRPKRAFLSSAIFLPPTGELNSQLTACAPNNAVRARPFTLIHRLLVNATALGLAYNKNYLYVQWVSMVFLYLNIYDLSGGGIRTRPRHVGRWRPRYVGRWRPNAAASCRAVAAEFGRAMSGSGGRTRPRHVGWWRRPNAAALCRALAAERGRVMSSGGGRTMSGCPNGPR